MNLDPVRRTTDQAARRAADCYPRTLAVLAAIAVLGGAINIAGGLVDLARALLG